MPTPPILHLSLPVRDLQESKDFYLDRLGCGLGRERDEYVDIWFYGMQLTLHEQPSQLLDATATGCRHFGVTLTRPELDELVARLDAQDVEWVDRVTTEHAGTPQEQTKAKLRDPSGNLIECKSYADPSAALERR
jgi:extradiol dioxygenase family protein